jgi:hypothetical protein
MILKFTKRPSNPCRQGDAVIVTHFCVRIRDFSRSVSSYGTLDKTI